MKMSFSIGLIICELCLLFASLLTISEETLAEFLSKATGTAVDWVQMIGMKVILIYYSFVCVCYLTYACWSFFFLIFIFPITFEI